MTSDEFKEKALAIRDKYYRGILTVDEASEELWQLAKQADAEDRQRVSVSSHDD